MATWTRLEQRTIKSSQTAPSDSAPSSASDGLDLLAVGGFVLIAECDAGQTFSSASGGFLGYLYDAVVGAWVRASDLDCVVPAAAVGQRRFAWPGFTVANPRGKVAHIASSLSLSGGNITTYYTCTEVSGKPV